MNPMFTNTVDGINPASTLNFKDLKLYGTYGIFLVMGNAGFIIPTVYPN